jgi:hypothetical protein
MAAVPSLHVCALPSEFAVNKGMKRCGRKTQASLLSFSIEHFIASSV